MGLKRVARILYNMHLGMDYADCIEESEEEIVFTTKELEEIKKNGFDSILQVLENIALQNEHMEFWKDNL